MRWRLPESFRARVERVFDASVVDYTAGVLTLILGVASASAQASIVYFHPEKSSIALITATITSTVLIIAIGLLALAHAQKIRKVRRLSIELVQLTNERRASEEQLRQELAENVRAYELTNQNLNVIFSEFIDGLIDEDTQRSHLGVL